MPALAVTTGGTDVEWVDVPTSRWRLVRRPAQRLPLDPRSARRARRYLRFEPWFSLARLAVILIWAMVNIFNLFAVSLPVLIGVLVVVFLLSLPSIGGALPRQTPHLTAAGDLRIPEVPIEVAKEWVSQNPGVVPTVEPLPRSHSRRWYATWSVVVLVVAVALFTVLAKDGREDSPLAWIGVLVLIYAGIATALKTLPPGYLRFDRSES